MGIASTVEGTTTAIGAVWDFADSAVNAWTKYYGEALNADMSGISADLKRQAAGSYLDQAASAFLALFRMRRAAARAFGLRSSSTSSRNL